MAAAAFAVGAVALGAWLLSMPRPPAIDTSASEAASSVAFTFAAWSARTDGILLVDVQAEGRHFIPKQFRVINVAVAADGKVTQTPDAFFSWAPEDRVATTSALRERSFPITNDEYRAYPPPEDPLSGEAPAASDAAGVSEQTVTLGSKGGLTAILHRRRSDPGGSIVWGERALGFPSQDGTLAYVLPDKVIIPVGSKEPPRAPN